MNTIRSSKLSDALIIVAIVTILAAVFIKNPYIKAALLAYEIFP